MESLDTHLDRRMAEAEASGLRRSLRRLENPVGTRIDLGGLPLVNFASNDYLGLARHPALVEAAIRAARDWGAGSGSSRLVSGSLGIFHELEETLAGWKRAGAALVFSTGYATALGTVPALVGAGDVVILDKRVHACCVDAARLSGARLRVFRHNDLDDLERILAWARKPAGDAAPPVHILVITESVFSMDGDHAPLRELVELKDRYGAWLMVDEAHAAGLLGSRRTGLVEALDLSDRVEVQMGTLGKALGAAGGYIVGSSRLRDHLVNFARSFVFSTAPVPAAAAAALAGVRLTAGPEGAERVQQLWSRAELLKTELRTSGFDLPTHSGALFPLIAGAEKAATDWSAQLRARGFLVPAIRFPTVARGSARLRVTVTADHLEAEVRGFARAALETQPKKVPPQ